MYVSLLQADVCVPAIRSFFHACFCSHDGLRAPSTGTISRHSQFCYHKQRLQIHNVPMMITITFNGPVNEENVSKLYNKLFPNERLNPGGLTARGTFFVSHNLTRYPAVQVTCGNLSLSLIMQK